MIGKQIEPIQLSAKEATDRKLEMAAAEYNKFEELRGSIQYEIRGGTAILLLLTFDGRTMKSYRLFKKVVFFKSPILKRI